MAHLKHWDLPKRHLELQLRPLLALEHKVLKGDATVIEHDARGFGPEGEGGDIAQA